MMKVSIDYPDELDKKIMIAAEKDNHNNRSLVIRQAIAFYLNSRSIKVNFKRLNNSIKKQNSKKWSG